MVSRPFFCVHVAPAAAAGFLTACLLLDPVLPRSLGSALAGAGSWLLRVVLLLQQLLLLAAAAGRGADWRTHCRLLTDGVLLICRPAGLPEHLGSAPPFGVIPMPPNGLLALDPPSPAAEPAPWQTLHSRLGSPLWVSAPCMAFLVLFLAAYLGWPTTVPELKRKSSEASLLVRSPARPLSLAAVTAPRLLFRQNSSGKCSNQGQDAGGDG